MALAIFAGGGSRLAAEPKLAEPAQLARRILADGRYQRTLPDPSGQGTGSGRGASRQGRVGGESGEPADGVAGGPGGASSPSFSLPSASGLGVARTLLWAFGAAVLVALVLAIARAIGRRPEPEAAPAVPGESGPTPLPDAAALAEAGDYGEALHALLLAAIHHGERRLAAPLPPSRTSRELTRLLPLHPDARPAFADLVRLVEGWLFGGTAVSRDDFARGAELYRAVVGRSA